MAAVQPLEAALRELNISKPVLSPANDGGSFVVEETRIVSDDASSSASSFSKTLNPNAQCFSPTTPTQPPTPSSRISGAPSSNDHSAMAQPTGYEMPHAQSPPPPPHPPSAATAFLSPSSLPSRPPEALPQHHPALPWMYQHPAPATLMMEATVGPAAMAPQSYILPMPPPSEPAHRSITPPPGMYAYLHSPPKPPPGHFMGMSPPSAYGWVTYGPASPPPPPPPAPSHGFNPYMPPPAPGMARALRLVSYGEYPAQEVPASHKQRPSTIKSTLQSTLRGAQQGAGQKSKDEHHSAQHAGRHAAPRGSNAPQGRRSFDSVAHHRHSNQASGAGQGSSANCHNQSDGSSGRRSCDGRVAGRDSKASTQASKDSRRDSLEEFAFDVAEARGSATPRTTLMIRNIPNKYSQKMLLALLDRSLSARYDFFYLPIDYKNRCNLGYAFINFRAGVDAAIFYEQFHNKRWQDFNSKKVCVITYAKVQGRCALVEHFKNSKFPCDKLDYLPLVFEPLEPSSDTIQSDSGVAERPPKMKAVPITLCGAPSTSINMVTAH
mmetsp:Transcript_44952/g.114951  ORF Transcript_44952/g.114951 Transcript_44952/m.114951 type:complete len:550 (+) Transcript_44952:389-2038(+)